MGNIMNLLVKFVNLFYRNKDRIIKYFFIFISVVISVLIFVFRDALAQLSSYGYFGIFLINLLGSATIVIPAPSLIATFVGGSIYNPLLVGVVSGIGASIGETTGYLAGYGGSVAITDHKHFKKIEKWMNKNGFITLLLLSFFPNPIFDLSGIFAGATSYSFKKYFTAVIIGKTLRFIGISIIGSYLL
jgi:uncharacterized membrane protein YdjX (TVP38/TMEM64 family)